MNQHLLIFGSVMLAAWAIATLLLVIFWPRLVTNIYKRALLKQGFGEGPVPINTLYTEPEALFAQPLTAQSASGSNLMTVGVNHDTLATAGWLDLRQGPQVLHVPDFSGRYYSVQFTDPFNVAFAYVGTRATGTRARPAEARTPISAGPRRAPVATSAIGPLTDQRSSRTATRA